MHTRPLRDKVQFHPLQARFSMGSLTGAAETGLSRKQLAVNPESTDCASYREKDSTPAKQNTPANQTN